MKFNGSAHPTVGMEIELQLLDPKTLDLVDGIVPLMGSYAQQPFVKPEYNQATVEINSPICSNIDELETHMLSLLTNLQARCEELNMVLCGAGTHPFCQRLVPITPVERYQAQSERAGYLSYWVTFAQHVHVGMSSGDEAVAIAKMLKPYLPILLALSANSPFWLGYDTGYACFRQRLLASRQTYGIPPSFKNWQDFVSFFDGIKQAGIAQNVRDLHWDLRLQPHLGTLEVRVMDTQATVKEAISLAALIHSLVVYLQRYRADKETGFLLTPLHWWLEKENYFVSSRWGVEANYIENSQGNIRPIKQVIMDILDSLRITASELGETKYLQVIREHLPLIPTYIKQRQIWQTTGSQKAVVAFLVRQLQQELNHNTAQIGEVGKDKDSLISSTVSEIYMT